MSAINPASFQTPTASLGLTPAPATPQYASNDNPTGRGRGYDTRRQPGPAPYEAQYEADNGMRGGGYMPPPFSYPPGMQPSGPGMGGFGNNVQMNDPFGDYYQPQYGMLNPNAPNFATGRPGIGSRQTNQSPAADWTGRFQGLSLKS